MKEYIKNNIVALLVGFSIGMLTIVTIATIEDIIVKIAILNTENIK